MIPFSVLDLSPIPEGAIAADALRNTLDLARQAEALGYRRYWLAEHHNMPGIASAATSIVIGHVAEPRAAGDRGAVRDPGIPVPRPHRSRPRAGARHRHDDGARLAPRLGD